MSTVKIVLSIIAIIIIFGVVWLVGKGCNAANKQFDNAIVNYEEFQSIHNTCDQLNADLCNIKDVPETDKMFEQISKQQRITGLKQRLNRWVEEYNAKSKMFNRSIWKSNNLPYQLTTNQFNCY
jgi:hypothetical protein